MKKVFSKLFLFFTPLLLIWLFIFIIDPYNLFNVSHIISTDNKKKCLRRSLSVAPRAFTLWNIIDYRRNPTPGILLGDSKIEDLTDSSLSEASGIEMKNLAIPGANINTLKDMFWMAAKTQRLKYVIIQISFINANTQNIDLYAEALKIIKYPYNYFINLDYLMDTFFVFYYSITKNDKLINWKNNIKEDPWTRSKKWIKSLLKENRVYQENTFKELKKISSYCKANNINFVFLVAPTFYRTHDMVKDAHLTKEYNQFIDELQNITYTINLNDGQPISFNRDNYYDYLHLKPSLADSLKTMIFASMKNKNATFY